MKKWIWIIVPAIVIGLSVIFVGGAVFAQEAGNSTAAPNWTAMYNYCQSFFTGNETPDASNVTGVRGCGGGQAGAGPGGMMGGNGGGGMMGNGSFGRGMMGW